MFALCGNVKCIAWHRCFTIRSTICELGWAGNVLITDRKQFALFFQCCFQHNFVEQQSRKITATLVRKSFVSKVILLTWCATVRRQFQAKNVSKTSLNYIILFAVKKKKKKKKLELELREAFKVETSSSKWITLGNVPNMQNDSKNVPLSDTQIRGKLWYMQ